MTQIWQKLSQTSRLFIAFGSVMVLIIATSVQFQANFFTSARLKHLAESEIPVQLEKLALDVRLLLEPAIQSSRILANDIELHNNLIKASPEERTRLIENKLLNIREGLTANSLSAAIHLPGDSRYFQLTATGMQQRPLRRDNPDDAWYFNFISSGQAYTLQLDTNTFSGSQLLMFIDYRSERSVANNIPLLVGAAALEASTLSNLISNYRLGEHGFVSLVTRSGEIQSSNPDSILTAISQQPVYSKLLDNANQQVFEQVHQGRDYMLSSIWVDSLQRWLIIEIPRAELTDPINRQMWAAQAIGFGLILLALLLIYPLARSLTRPLREVQGQLGSITQSLDLSRRIHISDQAELGQLAAQINKLLERLQGTVSEILRSSGLLNETALRLADTTGLGHTSSDTRQAAQTMAAAIEQMSSSVAEITSTMEELSASSTQIADHSQSVVDVANLTLDSSRKGAGAMQELEQHMTGIHNTSRKALPPTACLSQPACPTTAATISITLAACRIAPCNAATPMTPGTSTSSNPARPTSCIWTPTSLAAASCCCSSTTAANTAPPTGRRCW
ncbi:MAG: methyl-accepting chemotaxis protein [Thiopseudomonas sp.]